MKAAELIDWVNPNTIQQIGTVIIESLPNEDQKTGADLYNDLRYRIIGNHYILEYYQISSSSELDELFEQLIERIKTEFFHFNLQLETHGDRRNQGMILSDGTLHSWSHLFEYTRQINILLGNNFALMMSMCVGGACVSCLDPRNYSPFRVLISAFENVYPNDLYQGWLAFYEHYFNHPNPQIALNVFNDAIEHGKPLFYLISDDMAFNRICNPNADSLFFRKMVLERHLVEQYINPNVEYKTVKENILNLFRITDKLYRHIFCYRSPY